MGYHTIRYNKDGEPYIILKNFGHDPKDDESSSHWTWHITDRGIQHLSKDQFGRPQPMPTFINDEQLEDLKSFNMLRRSDGTPTPIRSIYPLPELPRKSQTPEPTKATPKTDKKRPANKTKQPGHSPQTPKPKVAAKSGQKSGQPTQSAKQPAQKPIRQPTPTPVTPPVPPQQPVAKQKKGFWGWVKSILGLD